MVQKREPDYPRGSVAVESVGKQLLVAEGHALLSRLEQVQPFEWSMTMVPAAAPAAGALRQIHHLIRTGRAQLKQRVNTFIQVLQGNPAKPLEKCQAAYSILRLQFNSLLDQLDIFADVVNQRSEHDTGIWIAGLDAFARDALRLKDKFYDIPELICYLDRGHGAAIRRVRTRLPGGVKNPVAIIRIPRERMVGSGIGSSLVHEVGHQGAALLGLTGSIGLSLRQKANTDPHRHHAWQLYAQWISEILSDMWSVAMLGISATSGLMNVVSLPAYFVFRMPNGDPHPFPWIRVKISLAFGRALYPDPQWDLLEKTWEQMYPTHGLAPAQQQLLGELEDTLADFIQLVLRHRPTALRGKTLREVFPLADRCPARLRALYREWGHTPSRIFRTSPCLVFASIGQARADNAIAPKTESRLLGKVLRQWALMKIINS